VAKKRGVEVEAVLLQKDKPVPCSENIQQSIREACQKVGLAPFTLPSGAGHDGMQFKDFCPIGMILVRSKNGISHNPAEWSTKEDCGKGTEILFETVLALAK
jgi:allantoate deiminase